MSKIQQIILDIERFINLLVPLVFAIAFIVFIWGVFQYFIAGGGNQEKRDTGKQFIMYGIIGFAIMLSVWGLVNIITGTLGLGGESTPCLPTFGDCKQLGNTNVQATPNDFNAIDTSNGGLGPTY